MTEYEVTSQSLLKKSLGLYFKDIWIQNFHHFYSSYTAQKIKFSIKDFFSKCDQIRRKLRIWLHLLKKSFMENFIFCAVVLVSAES